MISLPAGRPSRRRGSRDLAIAASLPSRGLSLGLALAVAALATAPLEAAAGPPAPDPWADAVEAYIPGTAAPPGFNDPLAALGSPARDSGVGIDPGVVSPFQPAFTPQELVAVGRGGELVLRFDEPVTDDPANPFGVDLLVFGNPFFGDAAMPAGIVAFHFSEGGLIDVSPDGSTWTPVPGAMADGGMPTLGWLDAGPYADASGREPSDFTRPVDPGVDPGALAGTGWTDLLALYDGSGGGTPIDLADLGLASISYVRIRSPLDAPTAIEIDAVADVSPVAADLPEDVDGDGVVAFGDVLGVLSAFGACPSPPADCPADVDESGSVTFTDLLAVLSAWGQRS